MHTFTEAAQHGPQEVGREVLRLVSLNDSHHGVAPGLVLPADYEEQFYRNNNLPEQLRSLFSPINPRRVDEDALEVLCLKAEALVRASYLLDDDVQRFYRALSAAALNEGRLHVRRDEGSDVEEARVTPPGTQALIALKKLWSRDWTFDAVLERLDAQGSVAIDGRASLIFAGGAGQPDERLAAQLGWSRVLVNEFGVVGA
ncbi:hypothetical protein [Deinococcus peraridilitoris]|uniref:hypothetical protein n=1 Tax=Deinococcus peraridilitoris TaxID=432329 RepID=UPI00059E1F26|nr:hypothetical protein [Deinococcus peraridilitoris]